MPTVSVQPGAHPPSHILERVRQCAASVTRYPLDILTGDAQLEDELGIDSVKQAEVMAVLMKELGLGQRPASTPRVRTIAALCEAARAWMPSPPPEAPASRLTAPAPVHTPLPSRTDLPFAGKIALVTGSGKGIGKIIATRLARAGATVAVNSFHSREEGEKTTREIIEAGGKALHLWGSSRRKSTWSGCSPRCASSSGDSTSSCATRPTASSVRSIGSLRETGTRRSAPASPAPTSARCARVR